MTRLFLRDGDYHGSETCIIELPDSEIEDTTNSYENFIENDDADEHFSDDDFSANEDGSFELDGDLPKWIENLIADTWNMQALTEEQKNSLIKASQYTLDHSDEADATTVFDISFEKETGFTITETKPARVGEHYTYWDGNNHKTLELLSDFSDTGYSEITDDYPHWEEKECVYSGDWSHGMRSCCWAMPDAQNEGLYVMFLEDETQWQGSFDSWRLVENTEDFWYYIYKMDSEDATKYFKKKMEEKATSVKLKKGEELSWDDYPKLLLSYRHEDYHFTAKQVDDLENALTEAREAIRERRFANFTDRLAQNNYEAVLNLPLQKIFVAREDSISAGNCVEVTDDLIQSIKKEQHIVGSFALRADELLKYRDDNYSRRAILKSFRSHYLA